MSREENNMEEPKDHKHIWVKAINSMALVCQKCQWRKNPLDGTILPPDDATTNAHITE